MVLHLLVLLLSCRIQAVGAQMKLSPEKLTVLRGGEARFTCAPNTEWTVMVWLLNGKAALTISKEHGVLKSINTTVTAEKDKGDSWVFVLKSTERHNQGRVTCDLQSIDRKTATLLVQEKGSVTVFGDDRLAFKGHSVLFECQAAGWYPKPSLQWEVGDRKVSQGEYNISSEESGKSLFTVSSNLSVTATKSSHVCCLASVSALPTPLKSSVRLTVVSEVVQDCTVPLVVTASLSALLLLILLCICTVLCYRQRRQAKSSPQEAIWIDQLVAGRSLVAGATGGKVNLGYSTEGSTDADYSERSIETRSQMAFVSFRKVPDVVHSSSLSLHSESQAQVALSERDSQNVRRITTV
ncbi:immunoglobulin superfamily member 5-like [Lates japonicus]